MGRKKSDFAVSGTPEYHAWEQMRARCRNKNHHKYPIYGARGITVCNEWGEFSVFHKDMGDRPGDDYSIDRIDNNGMYCKENCRWATRKEQQNNRRVCRILTVNGTSLTVSQWGQLTSQKPNTILYRIRRGWKESESVFGR